VRQGAIAGWAEDYEILASFAKQHRSLTVLSDESIGLKLDGIGVRENDSELRDAINLALQRIASSGRYADIYDRWFGPDSETPVPLQGRIEVWPQG
jgi:polar amino acid transport system substrate-binding protein